MLRLGEQSGVRTSGKPGFRSKRHETGSMAGSLGEPTGIREQGPGDTGTAARFFYQASWQHEVAEQLAAADTVRYQAKAARTERDAGLEGCAEEGVVFSSGKAGRCPVHNTTNPSGKNTYACGCAIQYRKERKVVGKARNIHPTCKPIDLIRWLATLLLPPAEYAPRRVLVPFAGSGSEMIGCGLAGWDEIVGVELMPEYAEIAEARLAHWLENVQLELI